MMSRSIEPTEIQVPDEILTVEKERGTAPANPFSIASRGSVREGEDYAFYSTPDTTAEIKRLLEFNGMDYTEENGGFQLIFSSGAKKWRSAIAAQENYAIICSEYPFKPKSFGEGAALCSKINEQLVMGCAYMSENGITLKTAADIFDGYYAYEAIARALEYNAGAMLHYWENAYKYAQRV